MKNKTKFDLLMIAVVGLIIMLPFLIGGYQSADDAPYHVANIDVLTDNLRENFLFPSNIYGKIANDFGYGTKLFYPPLSHTVTAYLNLIVNNPCISLKIVHLVVVILSGITMYYLSLKMSNNRKVALMSGVIYMLLPYHLSDIYIRDALAECFVFPFIPMIFNGILSLFKNKKNFYPLFITGYVGCMLSHLVLTVYLTFLIIIWLLIRFKETIKNLKPFIIASIVILLIASPFLVTLFEHKFLGNYHVYVPWVMVGNMQFENGLFLYEFINILGNFFKAETKFCFETISLVLLIITVIKYKKLEIEKQYLPIWLFLIVSLILSTRYFPWDSLPLQLRLVQFPWRFVGFAGVAFSLVAPLCLKDAKDKTIYILIYLMLALSFGNVVQLGRWTFNTDAIWYDGGMGWQKEYLPENTSSNYDYFENRNHDIIVTDGSLEYELVTDKLSYIEFDVKEVEKATIELPRLYYLGYYLESDQGNIIPLTESNYGFLEAKIDEVGKYTLEYRKTKLERVSEVVSLITITTSLMYLGWRRYRG